MAFRSAEQSSCNKRSQARDDYRLITKRKQIIICLCKFAKSGNDVWNDG